MRSCVLLTLVLISYAAALPPSPPLRSRSMAATHACPTPSTEYQIAERTQRLGRQRSISSWHRLRVEIDVSRYSGTNLGAQQHALSIMGGGRYKRTFHRERLFVEALFGDVGMNRDWGPNAQPGESTSFTTLLGGGLDTPLSKHFALRIQGDYRNENLALIQATSLAPYRVPGLPQNFGSISTGLVWAPRLGRSSFTQASAHERTPVAK